jgi:hypothetical protein
METLLRHDFTIHYGLPISTTQNICITTNAQYFEIEDDENRETQLHYVAENGVAKYNNANNLAMNIINYDKFITSLPHYFQQGKKRCDLIVHTTNNQYFLLNELKDRSPTPAVRTGAIKQLISSLTIIMNVPSINAFANNHTFRHCCFFNTQAMSPQIITATTAFNRINAISTNGFQMSNPDIETFGFRLYEYSGNQIYTL